MGGCAAAVQRATPIHEAAADSRKTRGCRQRGRSRATHPWLPRGTLPRPSSPPESGPNRNQRPVQRPSTLRSAPASGTQPSLRRKAADPRSSNGRTTDSESVNHGSNPCRGSISLLQRRVSASSRSRPHPGSRARGRRRRTGWRSRRVQAVPAIQANKRIDISSPFPKVAAYYAMKRAEPEPCFSMRLARFAYARNGRNVTPMVILVPHTAFSVLPRARIKRITATSCRPAPLP